MTTTGPYGTYSNMHLDFIEFMLDVSLKAVQLEMKDGKSDDGYDNCETGTGDGSEATDEKHC